MQKQTEKRLALKGKKNKIFLFCLNVISLVSIALRKVRRL